MVKVAAQSDISDAQSTAEGAVTALAGQSEDARAAAQYAEGEAVAAAAEDAVVGAVQYNIAQTLTDEEKDRARRNIAIRTGPSEFSPYDFGAYGTVGVGDGEADTAALVACCAAAVAQKRPVLLTGTLFLTMPPTGQQFYFSTASSALRNHISVPVDSGLRVYGRDCTIVPGAASWTPSDLTMQRWLLFGTPFVSLDAGNYEDIEFDGVTFDFSAGLHPVPFVYSFGVYSCNGFSRRNIRYIGAGDGNDPRGNSWRGRGIIAENSFGRRDYNIYHRGTTQGVYTHYDSDWSGSDMYFDDMSEPIDIDNVAYDVQLSRLKFSNCVYDGCLDLSGVQRLQITDILAENVSSIAFIYPKVHCWPDYSTWASHNGEAAWESREAEGSQANIPCDDVTIRGVKGKAITAEAFRVGNLRSASEVSVWPGILPPLNVKFHDWDINGGLRAVVNEAINLDFQGMRLRNFQPGTNADVGVAALILQSGRSPTYETVEQTKLSGRAEVTVENCQGVGVQINAPTDEFRLDAKVINYNLQGEALSRFGVVCVAVGEKDNKLILGRIDVRGGSPSDFPLAIGLGNGGADSRISMLGPFNFTSTATLPFIGLDDDVTDYFEDIKYLPLGKIDMTSVSEIRIPIVHADKVSYRLLYAAIVNQAAITGDGTNYTGVTLKRSRAGTINSLTNGAIALDNANVAADRVRQFNYDQNDTYALLAPGDTLLLSFSKAGAGSVCEGLMLAYAVLPFTRV